MVARGRGFDMGEMGEGGQKVYTSSYKISHEKKKSHEDIMYIMMTTY